MTLSEIDSFYFKFKNLLIAEKDATLTLKSEAGQAQVTLSVDLGYLHPRPDHLHHASNSRTRRKERQAAAQEQVAEVADKSPEKVDEVPEPVEVEKAND